MTKTIKKSIGIISTILLFLLASVGALILSKPIKTYAATNVDRLKVDVDNANFDENTSSTQPFSPNDFTLSNPDFSAVNKDNIAVQTGVIDVEKSDYSTLVSPNSASSDNYVLMLSSKDKDKNDYTTHLGYVMNNHATLKADSYYMMSVFVYTSNNDSIVDLYLLENDKIVSSMLAVSSFNNWTQYSFFVKTGSEDMKVKLGMYLSGSGYAFFDNISCYQLNTNSYQFNINDKLVATRTETDLTQDNLVFDRSSKDITANTFINSDSEPGKSGYEYTYSMLADNSDVEASDNEFNSSFKIENKQKTYTEYSTADDYFTFEPNRVYKVTVTLKAMKMNGKATLQLVETNLEDGVEGKDSSQISITSNTSNSINNNFTNYSFYVVTHHKDTRTFKLVVTLGDNTTNGGSTGVLYISNISLAHVNYSSYSSADSNNQLNLAEVVKDNQFMLNNGNFNGIKVTDYTTQYPAEPIDWTVTKGSKSQEYGVVSAEAPYDNVLMMRNLEADTISYTSTSKSLSAKSYHKFSLDVNTEDAPATISLVSKKDSNEITLTSLTINTQYEWKNVELYIYTGYQPLDISLKISMTSDRRATTYADNARFDFLKAPSETEFNNINNSDTIKKVDLSKLIYSDRAEDFATTTLFSVNTSEKFGIVSLNSPNLTSNILSPSGDLETFKSLNVDSVLGLRALDYTAYNITSNIGYKLTSKNYYKVVLYVYTQNLDSTSDTPASVSVRLTGFDKSITNIDTEVKENGEVVANEWQRLVFYINPDSDVTTYLNISLGSSEVASKGDVFIGGLEFIDEGLTAEDFKVSETDNVKILETVAEAKEEDTKKEDTTDKKVDRSSWLYVAPSIIFALAIIIAIVGVAVRKIKWKKPVSKKKSKAQYDRNQTVSKQFYARKASQMREEKLAELNKDLASLYAQRSEFELGYKNDLAKLRDMKIKRVNPKEIAKLERDMKKNQKLSANIGLNISKIENEISYVKSDVYLNALKKKLATDRTVAESNTDEKK